MKSVDFHFADWLVEPGSNAISKANVRRQMEPRVMDVLVVLCRRVNEVVSSDELLKQCWGGAPHGDNPVHKAIAQLRSLLGDNSKMPVYIETIRKRGYRILGEVVPVGGTSAGSWAGKSPFRGLRAFGEGDAPVFFGRTEAIARLLETVASQARAGRGLTLVLGASGSGKTSLVRAGLLPALLAGGQCHGLTAVSATSFDLAEAGQVSLLTVLGGVLMDWQVGEAELFSSYSGESLGARLQHDFDSVLDELHAATASAGPHQRHRLVLFIDRFETIFAANHISSDERNAFLAVLDKLAGSKCVSLILACRNDFYPQLVVCPVLMTSKTFGGHFDLPPPSPGEIAQIIRLPAIAANLHFGVDPLSRARLDDVLCAGAANCPDALPLLQHTLQELFRLRTVDGELSFEVFRAQGGLDGAIGKRAEEIVGEATQSQAAALPHVLSLLVMLSERDDVVTSRRAPWSALTNDAQRQLVSAFVDARLFVSELVGDVPGFGIAHETLLRRWPRAVAWIEEHRSLLRVRTRLQLQALRWVSEKRTGDLLLPKGKQLDEALSLIGNALMGLSDDEKALVYASANQAAWRARLRMSALSAIVALALLATAFGLSAMSANRVAQDRRTEAEGLMGFMLGDFSDKLRPLGRLDLLDSVSGKALDYLSTTDNDHMSQTALTQRAKALHVLAEVHVARGQPAEALAALGAARTILERQQRDLGENWEVLKSLGANAFWHGQIHLGQSRWDQAKAFFDRYEQYGSRLYRVDPGNPDAWVELSYAHTNLGLLALKRGDAETAATEIASSIRLKERARMQRPHDSRLAGELANSLAWLGNAKETLGLLSEAMQVYEREMALVQPLHTASPGEALWASRLVGALQRRSKLRAAMGRAASARSDIDQAAALMQAVVTREPDNRVWQGNLAALKLDQLRAEMAANGGATPLIALQALAEAVAGLVRIDPTKTEWLRLHALVRQTAGTALIRADKLVPARASFEEALGRLRGLHQKNRADPRAAADLARALLASAELAEVTGDQKALRISCDEASASIKAVGPIRADYRILDPWIRSQECLGNYGAVISARQTLSRIGYQDASYLRHMSKLQQRK